MFGYHVPAPNQAMLISGGKQKMQGDSTLPFRIVTGHGAFVMPVARKASYLSLAMREAVVTDDCVTQQGITLSVKAVIAFKVGSDESSIAAAAQRFLDDQDQMDGLTGQIFAGHLRPIVGSMTVESIIRERQTLAENRGGGPQRRGGQPRRSGSGPPAGGDRGAARRTGGGRRGARG
jgi:uncharacterized membrane protein YqiK